MRSIFVFALLISFSILCSTTGNAAAHMYLQEPGLIDIHAHIGKFRGFDLSIQNLLTNLSENHVRFALISNIDGATLPGLTADGDEITINQETARVSQEHPQLLPLAWAKPGSPGANASNIEPFLRDQKFLGVKFHPDFNRFPANGDVIVPYLQLCEKYSVPALFHCGRSSRSNAFLIYEIAKKFPRVPFVLYHMGFGTSHRDSIEVATNARKTGDALIYLETSQVDASTILEAIHAVGADRILFGSDATYYGRYHYDFYVPVMHMLKLTLSAEDFQKIIQGNAIGLFHLENR